MRALSYISCVGLSAIGTLTGLPCQLAISSCCLSLLLLLLSGLSLLTALTLLEATDGRNHLTDRHLGVLEPRHCSRELVQGVFVVVGRELGHVRGPGLNGANPFA